MRSEQPSVNESTSEASRNRRRHPRFTPQDVHSLLGVVLDLSASGMRVLHQGPPVVEVDENFDMLLQDGEGDVVVPVRVARVEPLGAHRQTIGLEFTRESPEIQQRLLTMQSESDELQPAAPRAFRVH